MRVDFAVIGGGIVGISAAMHVQRANPGASIVLLEKEEALARHQTGRNSGVIHAGVYYAPGSLKARFCREGAEAMMRFCVEHDVPLEQCGKLVVATEAEELPRLVALRERCGQNGLEVEYLNGAALSTREPRIHGLAALVVPTTGIVSYGLVSEAMANALKAGGAQVRLSTSVIDMREEAGSVAIVTTDGVVHARYVVVCAGLMADKLAQLCGIEADFHIIPFRGEYYRLPAAKNDIVKHLIYPVPDPALPFLGVHLTRMIDGSVTVGPNAVLSFAREGYQWSQFSARDVLGMASFPGFWPLITRNMRSGLNEMRNSLFRRGYLELCQRYCPELTLQDLQPHPSGVRAQAVMRDGTMAHDFLIRRTARTIHVCNAPSPAATSAIPIGRYISTKVEEML